MSIDALIDPDVLAALRETEALWPDSVQVLAYAVADGDTGGAPLTNPLGEIMTDPLGEPETAYTPQGDPFSARLTVTTAQELAASGEVTTQNALLNVPLAHAPRLRGVDRVQVVERWGQEVDMPLIYELQGEPTLNALEYIVALKRVTT